MRLLAAVQYALEVFLDRGMSNTVEVVKTLLQERLNLGDAASALTADSLIMGVMPEFDSMAVVNVIAGLEAILGKTISDDEITTEMFESVGSLAHFIETYQA